jgi:integrase
MQTYDLDQTAELIEAMRPTRMFVPTLLAVLCGMRRGEVAALRWQNVDLVAGRLAVVESAEQVGQHHPGLGAQGCRHFPARIGFHDLRHAHATHLLSSGVHPKVASERLGHSKIGITLDLYSHVMPRMQEDAAERVDAALQAAINKRTKAIG